MAKPPKFNLNQFNKSTTASEEIKKIEIQKDFNFSIIPYEKLCPSPDNKYDPQKKDEIKESIRKYGLFHNFLVIPLSSPINSYEYHILSGSTRYLAIGELLADGHKQFISGVPCRVIDKNTPKLDQEIIIEEANLAVRDDPKQFRNAVERLKVLYEQKNEAEGTNTSITKQIAEKAGVSQRQIQKYSAVNTKLIPELQELLDNDEISLTYAAEIASLTPSIQRAVLEMINIKTSKSKKELDIIREEAKRKEKEYTDEINKIKDESEIAMKRNELLNQEIESKNSKIAEMEKKAIEVLNSISSTDDKETLAKLNDDYEILLNEISEYKTNKNDLENMLKKEKVTVRELKRKLADVTSKPLSIELSNDEKARLSDEYEINKIIQESKVHLQTLISSARNFKNKYGISPELSEQLSSVRNIASILGEESLNLKQRGLNE